MTFLKKVKSIINGIIYGAAYVGATVTAFMMFLTVFDVVGRRFFDSPIPGAFELTRISLVLVVFSSLGLAQIEGENIGITVLYEKFSKGFRNILDLLIAVLSIGLFYVIFSNTVKYSIRIAGSKQVTSVLRLPVYPWIALSAVGVGVLIIALLWDLIRSVQNFKGEIDDES